MWSLCGYSWKHKITALFLFWFGHNNVQLNSYLLWRFRSAYSSEKVMLLLHICLLPPKEVDTDRCEY